jgi:dihydroorotase (multifunctional complex type)
VAYELGIEGGILVSGKARRRVNLYVEAGTIAAVTPERHESRQRVDASDLFVLPGMIDGHVHFQDPGDTTREDFITGSSAAAAGGTTTVIEHTHSDPVRSSRFFQEKRAYLQTRSLVDYGLAAHVWPEDVSQVESLWRAGAQFFKAFTCTTHGVPALLPGAMLDLFRVVARFDGLCLVHCEDEFITAANEESLKKAGRKDYGILLEWRTREAEQVAASTAALLVRLTGARTIIAHVSHPHVLDLIARDRGAGARVWVESCPQYFYLREEEVLEHGPLRKFTPPARNEAEAEALWQRLDAGEITHISTDHARSNLAQKAEGKHDMWQCHFGLPGIQTTLTMLLNAVNGGRLTLERIVQVAAEMLAKLYRLWPKKGCLEPGADADLVLVDMAREQIITSDRMLSKAGWSPYEGFKVKGIPAATILAASWSHKPERSKRNPGQAVISLAPARGNGATTLLTMQCPIAKTSPIAARACTVVGLKRSSSSSRSNHPKTF